METRECPQYLDLVRSNSIDFVGLLIKPVGRTWQVPTIKNPHHEIAFQLFARGYRLPEPSIKERNVVYEWLTYSSELYVSAN
jgi:hypothetical protein